MNLIFKRNDEIILMKISLLINESKEHRVLCSFDYCDRFLGFASPRIAKLFFIHMAT